MNLNTIFNNYLSNGYSNDNAVSKTCQDILITLMNYQRKWNFILMKSLKSL